MQHLQAKPVFLKTDHPGVILSQEAEIQDAWLYQVGAGAEIFTLKDLEDIDECRTLTETQRQTVIEFLQQQASYGHLLAPTVETDLATLLEEEELPDPITTPLVTAVCSPAHLVECYRRGQRYFGALSLSGVDLGWSKLPGIYLAGADISGADLRGAELWGANLRNANLANSHLCGVKLAGANLRGANLAGANLRGAQLSEACMVGADLSGANLTQANLSAAELWGAYLVKANLSNTNLYGVQGLDMADQKGADFTAALMPEGHIH